MEGGKSEAKFVIKHDNATIVSSLKKDVYDYDRELQKQRQKLRSTMLQSQHLQRRKESPTPLFAPPTNATITQYRRERLQRNNNSPQLDNMKLLLTETNRQSKGDTGLTEKNLMTLYPTLPATTSTKNVNQMEPYTEEAVSRDAQTRLEKRDRLPLESIHNPSMSPKSQQHENHHVLVRRNLLAIQSNLEKLSFPSEADLAEFSEARHQYEVSTSHNGTGKNETIMNGISVALDLEQKDLTSSTSLRANTLKIKSFSEDLHALSSMAADSTINWLLQRLFEIKMFINGVAAGISLLSSGESFLSRAAEEFVREVPRLAKESRRLFYITASISIFISVIFTYLCSASQKVKGHPSDSNRCSYTSQYGTGKSHRIPLPKQITVVICGCCYLVGLILSLACEVTGRQLLAIRLSNDQQEQYQTIIALWKALNLARCLFCTFPWIVECFVHT